MMQLILNMEQTATTILLTRLKEALLIEIVPYQKGESKTNLKIPKQEIV